MEQIAPNEDARTGKADITACIQIESSSDDHICPECMTAFSTSENLRIHRENVHYEQELSEEIPADNGEERGQIGPSVSEAEKRQDEHNNRLHENFLHNLLRTGRKF